MLRGKSRAAVHTAKLCGDLVHGAFGMCRHGLVGHTNERRGRGVSFKAAFTSTGARHTVSYDYHVAQLACRAGIAGQQLAADDHAAAHTGTKRDHHGALRALGSTRHYLRQSGGIGVVDQAHGETGQFLQSTAHIVIDPAQITGIDHRAAFVIHDAGTA